MPISETDLIRFLSSVHPYDSLEQSVLRDLAPKFQLLSIPPGAAVYELGEDLAGLYLVHHGEVEVVDDNGMAISILGPRNSFGERGLTRGGRAVTSAKATTETVLLLLPRSDFDTLMQSEPSVSRFFDRRRPEAPVQNGLTTTRAESFMAAPPVTCSPGLTCQGAAQLMREHRISCICISDGDSLLGILTTRDLTEKLLAEGLPFSTPVSQIMTKSPRTLPPSAIGSDVLHAMMEHHIGHIPVVQNGQLKGIITQTDLTRFQAVSSAELVSSIARAKSAAEMAKVAAETPRLLVQLVAGGNRHEVVTRLITDIADTVTRRLLKLAEETLGPAPVPYLWLACGSQGRQEQTGVSDQDNCLILSEEALPEQDAYFAALARFVCDGLNTCGYVYCPGDMMATNARWRQPLPVWRDYFGGWITKPGPEAQMLASVMFDLRPIGGDASLFEGLQAQVLASACANSIFVAHMTSNALKHTPPLGLLRGFATIRSGEHRNTLDMKHNGVVPVTDLGRIYALQAKIPAVNTRARLEAGASAGAISPSGARDLLDAYDLIAQTRLEHQADLVRQGQAPDNYLAPSDLSDFERSHLRDAFVVVKTMQSALGHGKGMLG
ncbi:putative nucleotidyltransferase substrate binding domain-containing protein [Pseudophaeobacter sp.]|uniref:putative nucleotidyltransferase substrate binding domain-containing protein n=1 Tax=Pseudophaeobacter sp. TaxID=1971739 RepID=UPI0032981FEC